MASDNSVDLLEHLGNDLFNNHPDFMRQALGAMLAQFMEAEITQRTGAAPGERTEDRLAVRNGYRSRPLETRMGTLELAIPKLRSGPSYLPSFIEPRKRWEKAFVSIVAEAYVHGVSTRKVEELVEAMGAQGMSRSEVSRMAAVLDEQVEQFRSRPLDARAYPYLYLDAIYIKVRQGTRVVSMACLVAIGVSDQGEREIVGVDVAEGEMEPAWRAFLRSLVQRGLSGVRLVVSDAHEGLAKARVAVFNGAAWQRCRVHFMRNMLAYIPKRDQGFVGAALKQIFAQRDHASAVEQLNKVVEMLEKKYAKVAALVAEAQDEVLAYMTFPSAHWRQLHSTNVLERLNREIRRRTRVVGLFPHPGSALRLIGMLLAEQHDEWAVGRRYFSLESMALLDVADRVTVSGALSGPSQASVDGMEAA